MLVALGTLLDGKPRVVENGKVKKIRTYGERVKRGERAIVMLLAGLANHYFKKWCFPTQEKICELLKSRMGITMSVRTLNRHLNALQQDGFLWRKVRHRRDKHKGMMFDSTLYTVAARFVNQAAQMIKGIRRAYAEARKNARKSGGQIRSSIRVPETAEYKTLSIRGYNTRE